MRRFALAFAAVAVLGCGGDSSGPGSSTAVGTWNLVTINGASLPYTVFDDPTPPAYKIEVISDQFVVHAGGTFDQLTTVRETIDGTATLVPVPDTGVWTQTGSSVTVTFDSDTSISAVLVISGNTATSSEPGFVAVYQRQ
jgi:hypothetical protein